MLLGNYHVQVDAQTCGMTPLHLAAANGNEDVIFLLTSVYKARTDIRDFCGRLPSAYLPKEKEALAKYLPNPLRVLLQNCNNYLYLLVSQPETNRLPSDPVSNEDNSNNECSSDCGLVNNLNALPPTPINSHFPWSQSNQNCTEESRRQSSLSQGLGSVRSGKRDSSRDRHRMYKTLPSGVVNKIMCFPLVDLKFVNTGSRIPTVKLKFDDPKRIFDSNFRYDDVKLIQNVYTHIRQRRKRASFYYNPCNPESTKSSEPNVRDNTSRLGPSNLRSTIGRQLKRHICNARSAMSATQNNEITELVNNNNGSDDDDEFTDPPTPTNELNDKEKQ
ncbi:unnamed protein product [Schistosoma mattheei]|uniref:Uncharacterized protein n=1 Tax=Schistosoma mattheei TaxID=31246 RepID=A0A3P8F035_9TREM|nr:unnamed protein product [Schistosoma mattheei]